MFNTDKYWLYDSDTNEAVNHDELGISIDEYEIAIADSLNTGNPEGHIYVNDRRVYAAE